jgi:predicted  nucleic acid-binding Zn-ribbon protein
MNNQMVQFNTLISQASDAIMCNSECRKQREAEKLKQKYLNSQTNLASASNQVEDAQKNYVTFTEGETAYNDLQEHQLEEKAQVISDKFIENFNEEVIKLKSQINTYKGLLLNFKNVFELFRSKY